MAEQERLASLDVFRGLTMLYMASEIWGLPRVARRFEGDAVWDALRFHTSHVPWTGGSAWDLIQPAFMFMVGVALPWSVANRRSQGQGLRDQWRHALTSMRVQGIAAAAILVLYWAAFALYPAPAPEYDWAQVGVAADWAHHQSGFAAHWDKNSNLAAAADQWLLNLFPRERPFAFNGGGYQTLNFVPSLATMIFGLLAGGLLRSGRRAAEKIRWLIGAGAAGIAGGWLAGALGICPVVKRIWTPSWALASGGCVLLLLAALYWWIDGRGQSESWSWVSAVGKNSIAMYTMVHLWDRWLAGTVKTHLGWNVLPWFGEVGAQVLPWMVAWAALCAICVWMDRRRVYWRI